jgi:hypothetical protein
VIKNKIKQFIIHRYFRLLVPVVFFFPVQMSVDLLSFYAMGIESADQYGYVTIHFQFDQRLKARPFRIFIKKENEWYESLDNIDTDRVQFYELGKVSYDFKNIKPGIYWVGFSFKFLKKNELNGSPVLELEYVRPGITTGDYEPTENRIEVKKSKRVFVDLNIHISLTPRPAPHGKEDPQGNLEFIERSKPKSPGQDTMLDGNFFPLGSGIFTDVKRSSLKNIDHSKISFEFIVFNDYPLAHWQRQDD